MTSPFHSGEKAVQTMVGVSEIADKVGRMLQPQIATQAIPFIQQQPMVVIASTDAQEQLWTSLLIGDVGFIEVLSGDSLVIHEDSLRSATIDVLFEHLKEETAIGMLFHEMESRRRYRVNGMAVRRNRRIEVNVQEAYVNCPKYIQRRTFGAEKEIAEPQVSRGQALNTVEQQWIAQADTFFMATQSLAGKADASHRGGNPGFVEVLADGRLRIPDYPGNNMFNSLGNIYENPKAGLLFVDFHRGSTLQLSGAAVLEFDQNTVADMEKTGDTGRFWIFEPKEWVRTDHHHQANWDYIDASPFNP